jgi:nucleotide-binding universal stress UspA family protein
MILGWPGTTDSPHSAYGSVIDLVAANPPCDLAIVRFRKRVEPRRILVPTSGGVNAQLAIRLAIDQARRYEERTGEQPVITLQYVCVPAAACPERQAQGYELLRSIAAGYDFPLKVAVTASDDVVDGIVREAENHDLIVIGATAERFFDQVLIGTVPERVALTAPVTVMMVKGYRGPVRTWLRDNFSWLRRSFSWLFAVGEHRRARRTK